MGVLLQAQSSKEDLFVTVLTFCRQLGVSESRIVYVLPVVDAPRLGGRTGLKPACASFSRKLRVSD